jgi:ABC-type tungstate transport system permease subunit
MLAAPCSFGALTGAVVGEQNRRPKLDPEESMTHDSGLFEYLLPIFKQKTEITVKVLAQGTGQALDTYIGIAAPPRPA